MIFKETKLQGAFVIEIESIEDARGFNARAWCQKEFERHHLVTELVQTNIISNKKKGTLRGFHYQADPYQEAKLFRCTRGAIYDVIIDLRPQSPTYKQWFSVELSAENYRMLYVPKNFAQAFLTLQDDTEITYQVSQFYTHDYGRTIRYNDPAFHVTWPIEIMVISDKDKNCPDSNF